MKRVQSSIIWILLALAFFGIYMYSQHMAEIPDPPGWQQHHDRIKSGITPEEVFLKVYHIDPSGQMEQ